MAPLIAALFSQGFSLIANAALAKGQQVVEEKLGVKLDTATPELLAQKEQEHQETLTEWILEKRKQELEFQEKQESNVSDRWKSDMSSDSWLSKNIRPLVLIYLLTAYTILAFGSALSFQVSEAYVTLLGQWGMLVMTAYFGGRSLEKIMLGKEQK